MALEHTHPVFLAFQVIRGVLKVYCKREISLKLSGSNVYQFESSGVHCVRVETIFRPKDGSEVWVPASTTVHISKKSDKFNFEVGGKVVIFVDNNNWISFVLANEGFELEEAILC